MKTLITMLALAFSACGLPMDLESGHLEETIGSSIDAGQTSGNVVESCLTVAAMDFNSCMATVSNGSVFEQANCNQAWKSAMASCLENGC